MAYISGPTIKGVPTDLGNVNLAFTDAGHVYVSTDAHINGNEPTVTYLGTDYLVSVHLYAETDWMPYPGKSRSYETSLKRRPQWDYASRTAREAIVAALSSAVRAYVAENPDVLRQAEYVDANNEADQAEREASELAAKLRQARATARRERARQARNAPPAVTADAAPWPADQAKEYRATARRAMRDHGHTWDFVGDDDGGDDDDQVITRDSCGACVLAGWNETTEDGPLVPNYGAWARIYVEAGQPIPSRYREGFEAERRSDNRAYADALERSIATFGVTFA